MAPRVPSRVRVKSTTLKKKHLEVIEGEVMLEDDGSLVVYQQPPGKPEEAAFGFAAGGIIGADLDGKRVRIIVEEL